LGFSIDCLWALTQCSATVLPVIRSPTDGDFHNYFFPFKIVRTVTNIIIKIRRN